MSSSSTLRTGPVVFFNAKQLHDAELEAQDQIIYRHHAHALDRLKALDDQLLAFSPQTATQSAFYIVSDVLNHVANCISNQDEHDALRNALEILQYRITTLNHGVDMKSGLSVITISVRPDPILDLNQSMIPEQCTHRLIYIFSILRQVMKSRVKIQDALQILEQLNREIISQTELNLDLHRNT